MTRQNARVSLYQNGYQNVVYEQGRKQSITNTDKFLTCKSLPYSASISSLSPSFASCLDTANMQGVRPNLRKGLIGAAVVSQKHQQQVLEAMTCTGTNHVKIDAFLYSIGVTATKELIATKKDNG